MLAQSPISILLSTVLLHLYICNDENSMLSTISFQFVQLRLRRCTDYFGLVIFFHCFGGRLWLQAEVCDIYTQRFAPLQIQGSVSLEGCLSENLNIAFN